MLDNIDIMQTGGRTLTGAWIETGYRPDYHPQEQGRTLTGAWIETAAPMFRCA